MITPYDCTLNGAYLSRQGNRICVLDIREHAPKLRTAAAALPCPGQHLIYQTRDSLSVEISFAIQEDNLRLRRQALQNVLAWAEKGGVLTISDRPGQQLAVICTALPTMAAADWTEPLTLVFTTTRNPYWESTTLTQLTGSGSMTVPGTAQATPVDVLITNTGADPITRLSLYSGTTYMIFEGITLPGGGEFRLTVQDGLLVATVNGSSVLSCRTPASSDLLMIPCGQSASVSALADAGIMLATFTARGRYV